MSIHSIGLSTWEKPSQSKAGVSQRSPPERAAYSPAETAILLGISVASIYRLMNRGALSSVLIGSSRRIPASEIHKALTTKFPPVSA